MNPNNPIANCYNFTMKGVKLKALYLRDKELFASPPKSLAIPGKQGKVNSIDNLEKLREMIRGRHLRKQNLQDKKQEDSEQVLYLGDVPKKSPRLLRKFTFRKQSTDKVEGAGFALIKLGLIKAMPKLTQNKPSARGVPNSIISKEKLNKTQLEAASATGANKQFEEYQRIKYDKASTDLERFNQKVNELTSKVKEIENAFKVVSKKYENEISILTNQEAKVTISLSEHRKKGGEETKWIIEKNSLRKEKQEKVQEYFKVKNKHEKVMKELTGALEEAKSLRRNAKKEQKETSKILLSFYIKALKKGMDVRSEGLRWIIKHIWSMGESVPISSFPKFIGDDSIYFLLSMAKKDIELQEFELRLNILKGQVNKFRSKSTPKRSSQERLQNIRGRIRQISQSSVGVQRHERTRKLNSVVFEDTTSGVSKYHSELCWVRENITRIKLTIEDMTQSEIKRVAKEYKKHGDKDIGLEHIIHCLVGDRAAEFKKFY